ncbi:MAG: esterase [Bryobacterales bacterium]|nr:esterase [Bryobacterales bacterium]
MHREQSLAALAAFVLLAAPLAAADAEIVAAAHKLKGPALSAALVQNFDEKALNEGSAFAQDHGQFLFAVRSASEPSLQIDDRPAGKMQRVKGSDLWTLETKLATGRSHAIEYSAGGKPIGRRLDIRAYTDLHYPRAGVAQGKVSEKQVNTSKIYRGMVSDWWYYISPGVEPGKPAPLMIWQDGQGFSSRDSASRLFTVTENLIADGKIPPMVHLMISPGMEGERRMRSIEYDTVNLDYTRFVLDEILPELEKHQKIRTDAYSRASAGQSSGGICAFISAWLAPNEISRVLSRIGSYTSIAWRSGDENGEDLLESGHSLPFRVRKGDKRNIRVWMEDGSNDLENNHGSWPLQNVQLANSLKMREYDFTFHFGNAQHSSANGDSMLPQALTWLWRDYDPSKTSQEFTMDPTEGEKPYFRIERLNRNH